MWVDNAGAGSFMTRFTPNGYQDYVAKIPPWSTTVGVLPFTNYDTLACINCGTAAGTSPALASGQASLCDNQPGYQLGCNYTGNEGSEFASSRSRHPGGVNSLFGDGSVHFMKNSINPLTWVSLGVDQRWRSDQLRLSIEYEQPAGSHREQRPRITCPVARARDPSFTILNARFPCPRWQPRPSMVAAIESSGSDQLGRAAADGLAGHAENDARRLVLGDGQGPGLAHLQQPAGAVVSHAGHDHAGRERAGGLGRRAKQHLDAGPVPADRGAFHQLDAIAGARPADEAVDVARDHQGAARPDRLVLPRLGDLDLDPRVVVQPLGERRS